MKLDIKGFITHKKKESFKDCADRYAFDKDKRKFALSDGVSQSFFPAIWANELVHEWVSTESAAIDEIIHSARKKWQINVDKQVNQPNVPWYTFSSFMDGKPGLATFVGLRFFRKGGNEDRKSDWWWKAYALGDSYLFFVPYSYEDYNNELIKLSSNENDAFDNYPDYYASKEEFKQKGDIKTEQKKVKEGTFFLMSDALAEWFIKEGENAFNKTKSWENQKHFERYIDELRHSEEIVNDDSAILIIDIKETCSEQFDLHGDSNVFDINKEIERDSMNCPTHSMEKEAIEEKKQIQNHTNTQEELKTLIVDELKSPDQLQNLESNEMNTQSS